METEQKREKKKRAPILRWHGMLSESPRIVRVLAAVILTVAGASLTFTQLGFVAVPTLSGDTGYMVVLLEVVALGALLLGTLPGSILGFATGGILFAHAQAMPLDHYELLFVTPVSSVIMFGICGLLLGVLFAFVLRKNPSQVKRIIYIIIVCLVVMFLYEIVFLISALIQVAIGVVSASNADPTNPDVQQFFFLSALQIGDPTTQILGTSGLMALLCCIGDFLARKTQAHEGSLGLRTVFGTWLSIVVALAFMVMGAMSFVVSTRDATNDAEEIMKSRTAYICQQIVESSKRMDNFDKFAEKFNIQYENLDTESMRDVSQILADDKLLSGLDSKNYGTILVELYPYLYLSNDDRFPEMESLDDIIDPQLEAAIETSRETERMERFVFQDPNQSSVLDGSPETAVAPPTIAYVYSQKLDVKTVNGTDMGFAVDVIEPSDMVFAKRADVMFWMTLSALALLFVVFLLVFLLLNRVVAKRIDEENKALALITDGNLETRAEAGGTREFESLSTGINNTVDALRGWIAEAETRMDAELATARTIQESALPSTFPPYPDILKFDVYASMNAAKEVGGDFYDFFLVGDDCTPDAGRVAFVVADVSGKGVPGALFMMKAKALLRDYVASGLELGEAVTETNRALLDGNDAGMFVTAWVGLLDYASGHVDFVNAGHNPPLIWRHDDGWQWMRERSGVPLGLFDMPYTAHAIDCLPGETFLLYTDGVTEAFSTEEEQYGEERLLAVAEKNYLLHPRKLLEAVRRDVAAFAEGAEQSDDITILTLEVGVPPEITATLEVPARTEELARVNDFLHAELDRRLCPQRVQNQLDIAVEELFVNVCHYAYPEATPEAPGTARIQRTYGSNPPTITVDIIDDGIPYNPLAKPDAVTPDNIEDVPIGGLGILMAKRCTDEILYERTGSSNVVTIVKKW